jgi:multidrug efflux pump subunit AcrB
MRIWLDPVRMAALGVTASDVSAAIRRDNVISTAGATEGEWVRVTVDALTGMQTPEEFRSLVVRQDADRQVRLGDVADVELAAENNQARQFTSGNDTVFMPSRRPRMPTRCPCRAPCTTVLPDIEANLPADLDMIARLGRLRGHRPGAGGGDQHPLRGGVIVILVIFLFLGSLRVVLIPLVAIPLSLIGVVFLILAMGFSLNLLTLLAMVIAIGLVVDDAIVVVENVHRHIEEGASPLAGRAVGAREVALPVIAMTLTLAAVYAPIAFIGGLTGALFSEFALTLAGAVLVSGVVALTLSPVMASRFLVSHGDQGRLPTRSTPFSTAPRRRLPAPAGRLPGDNRGAVLLFSIGILVSLPRCSWSARASWPRRRTRDRSTSWAAPELRQPRLHHAYLDEVVEIWKGIRKSLVLAGSPAGQQLRRPGAGTLGPARALAAGGAAGAAGKLGGHRGHGDVHLRQRRPCPAPMPACP